jgi:hypothetical protein
MKQKINISLFSFVILLVIFSVFGSTLGFKFNIIDEHQIVALLGTDNYLDFTGFKKHLLDIVLQIKNSNIRTNLIHFWWPLETFFFQGSVSFYYFFRLTLISIFFVTLFIYTSQFIGNYFSFILIILFLSTKSIADIATRILVSELVTLIALIFLLSLIFKFIKSNNYPLFEKNLTRINFFVYFFFFNFFIFSKESLLPFIIFPILFIYLHFKNKLNNKTFLLINFLNIFFFFIYCYLIFFLIYKDPSTLKGVINLELKNYIRIVFKFIKYCLISYSVHILIISYIFFKHRNIINLSKFYIILSISSAIIFFQFVIYNGNLPSNTRYDFVPDLLFYFNTLFLIIYLKKIDVSFKKFKILIIFFLFLFIFSIFKINNFYSTYKAVNQKKNNTVYFESIIKNIKDLSEKNPSYPIIIISTNVWDYELVSSIFKFLQYKDIKNKIFLRLDYTEKDMKNELEKIFYERLNDVSFQKAKINSWSNNPKNEWGYDDIKKFAKTNNCIEFQILTKNFTKEIKSTCKNLTKYIYN